MNYRFQEILRYCIPGLYLIAMVVYFTIDSIIGKPYTLDNNVIELCESFSSVIVLLIPFIGFAFGYIIECFMAFIERFLYRIGFPRPSYIVLRNFTSLYRLYNVNEIRHKLGLNENLSNRDARDAYQKAKQVTDRSKYENFFISSIMSRNILGAHLLSGFAFVKLSFISRFSVILFIALSFLFFISWYHRNCIYAKNVFTEYFKKGN